MTELERVYDGEVIEEGPSWEEHVSEWAEGARQEFAGQLRQARAAASVARHHGRSSMKAFAQEVGASKSKVYDYCRVWWVYGHLFEDGDFSGRFQTLGISHYLQALRAPDPSSALEQAEDEGLSVRRLKERIEESEHDGLAEEAKTVPCDKCDGSGRLPVPKED